MGFNSGFKGLIIYYGKECSFSCYVLIFRTVTNIRKGIFALTTSCDPVSGLDHVTNWF